MKIKMEESHMQIVTKAQVMAEMIVVPVELQYDFYVREVKGKDVVFYPVVK